MLGTPILLPLTIVIALPALSINFTVLITKHVSYDVYLVEFN
ncbi:unnamed protein product [Schistosoma margrebowiei]|uniref:Uncharacterized protein n=1 Tax=Schistosoma margrebowiei TaxID=48269 RepID=A0A183L9H7_9TREM|nr:unnamed protein product [Schistosoma margrebowiei]